jgi:hypothetical protein
MQTYRRAGWIPTLIAALPLIFGGCGGSKPDINGTFRGYRATLSNSVARHVVIHETSGFVYGIDFNEDGRIDEIGLKVPKGSPLERYANPDSLEVAYSELTQSGSEEKKGD